MIIRTLAVATLVALAVGGTASAQVPDHLQCYKVKDTAIVLKGTVDLQDQLSGPLSPCKISKAALYCRGSIKSNPSVFNITTPIVTNGFTGVAVADDQDRICYKVSCPKLDPPVADQTVTDQFGQHTLTKLKTGMLCTPASPGATFCGDNNVNGIEDCDGTVLGGATCVTLGYGSGTLACAPGCRYDVSGCIPGAFAASGQTTCYNAAGGVIACAGTGQDGEKQAGATLAYQDNGDGTVTDLNTGLMWEKQSDDNSIHDRDQAFSFANAQTHISAINGATFAGHTDWRLPNIRELQSLVNYGVANPAIASAFFHSNCFGGSTVLNGSCTAFVNHWSSTTVTNLPGSAFTVNFTDGTVGVFTKSGVGNVFAVRGVRGGPQ
jgi:uncharacterized protein DUF1566